MPHQPECRCPICERQRSELAAAVQMTVRIAAPIKKRILAHPKGARAYIESLVEDEPKHQGKLAAEKFALMQERQAHQALKSTEAKLRQQIKIYVDALQKIATANPGVLSQCAEQALYEASQTSTFRD